HLLNLHLFDEHGSTAGVEAEHGLNTLFLGADKSQGARLLDQLVDVLRALFRFAAAHEFAELSDDLSCPQSLMRSLGEGIVNLRSVRMLDAFHQATATLQVVGDGRERLVDLGGKR